MMWYIGGRFKGVILCFVPIPSEVVVYSACRLTVTDNFVEDEFISSVYMTVRGETYFIFTFKQLVSVMRAVRYLSL